MARKTGFKGKTTEELKAMPLDEFIKLIPSHGRRTMKRMSMQVRKFLEKFRADRKGNKATKTQIREMIILPEMLGARILVHAGKDYVEVVPTPEMLGHRLGEYAITIKMVKHSGPGIGATRGSKSVELK